MKTYEEMYIYISVFLTSAAVEVTVMLHVPPTSLAEGKFFSHWTAAA
jgi:hypothetical protein